MSSVKTFNIFVVEDDPFYQTALMTFLSFGGYQARIFSSANELLDAKDELKNCDLIVSDINMPGISGYELCRILRTQDHGARIPIVLVTGNDPITEKAIGIEAGADEFIPKPIHQADLIAKIRSLLDIRANEIETKQALQRAQKFMSPNIANLLKGQNLLKPHRAEVSVLFVDLRRFTSFSERCEAEEVLEVLSSYYKAVGNAAIKYKGTLGHLAGDGIMVFFNDPEPVPNHLDAAVKMAIEAREALIPLREEWKKRHYDIDFGIGISSGFATIGEIGFEQFSQYSVIGPVPNFAARLCSAACEGQILISHRYLSRLKEVDVDAQSLGEIRVKGLDKPVNVFNIISLNQASRTKAA